MKKIISLLLTLALISSLLTVSSFAEEKKHIYDTADILTNEEESKLESSLNAFSQNWGIDTRVVLEGRQMGTHLDYDAENEFAKKAVDENGVLMVINCQNNDAFTYAHGKASEILGNYGAMDVNGIVESVLDNGNYTSAVYTFISSLGAEFSDDLNGAEYIPSERLLPRLMDNAALLTEYESKKLNDLLDKISQKHKFDVTIATLNFLDTRSAVEYADDWFDYNGYGMGNDYSGILFLISMGERDWAISTHGYGLTAFTEAGQEILIDDILGDISGGYYNDAFISFAKNCDDFLTKAENGTPYDKGNAPKKPLPTFYYIISLIIALITGFAGAGALKSQLKSVQKQVGADNYSIKNSLSIPGRNEIFLFSNVSKTARPKETSSSSSRSSSHTSSSGRTHGGSSGKF